MNNFLEGFQIIKSSKYERIVVSNTYVSFSAALRKRAHKNYVGFYINNLQNEIIIHISSFKKAGYFSTNVFQYKSKNILDMFKVLGYGLSGIDTLNRLTFLDENTILIKRKGEK